MQRTIVPGVSMWSIWQPDRNLFFNSYFIEMPEGNLAVDPLSLDAADVEAIERRGGLAWIVVTTATTSATRARSRSARARRSQRA